MHSPESMSAGQSVRCASSLSTNRRIVFHVSPHISADARLHLKPPDHIASPNQNIQTENPALLIPNMPPFSDDSKGYVVDMLERDVQDLKVPFTQGNRRRVALDWTDYLTEEITARKPSALKAAFKHLSIPGIISLGGGLPLPYYFPIHCVDVTVPKVGKWSEEETAADGSEIHIVKYGNKDLSASGAVVHGNGVSDRVRDGVMIVDRRMPTVGLASTLQYGLGTGDPHLVAFLREHTQMVHRPPYEDWSTTLTCGNTYSFYTCCRMLLERGDYLVMEEYAYSSAISACGPLGIKIVGIEMDEQGMTATGLDHVLSTWDVSARGARKPRVIYLVPYRTPQERYLT